jgi:DNA-binding NtrC family response regulator
MRTDGPDWPETSGSRICVFLNNLLNYNIDAVLPAGAAPGGLVLAIGVLDTQSRELEELILFPPKIGRESSAHILLVDDDDDLRLIVSDRLAIAGYRVNQASSLREALELLDRENHQVVLLDIYLPDQTGIEGLRAIRARHASLPVIIMTAHGTIDMAVEAMKEGAYEFVTKPLDFKRLGMLVERAIESTQLKREIDYLRRATDEPFMEIIGERTGLKAAMSLVKLVADSDTTVLLRGETGTGKEVIARAIHRLSQRRPRPFVVANCAAIPRELMESEMFGHRKGAFTGAIADHSGFFETTGNGTLLLDEIGDLNLDLQAKILRVLEDGSYRKVGSSTTLRNRARIIASTHQPLEKMMQEGRFREDLFYRLNVMPILLPPLRERKEDIPEFARYFLRICARGNHSREMDLTDEAVAVLEDHPWRGNLRELRNCMERLAIAAPGRTIEAEDVRLLLHHRPAEEQDFPIRQLRDLERRAIMATLERLDGNRTKAAEALGIGRRTLQNKLKQYNIPEDRTPERSGTSS